MAVQGAAPNNIASAIYSPVSSGSINTENKWSKKIQAKKRHRKWFDEPIDKNGKNQSFWCFADSLDATEVNLQYHRIDHHPDQNGNGNIDIVDFQSAQVSHAFPKKVTDSNPNQNAHAKHHKD